MKDTIEATGKWGDSEIEALLDMMTDLNAKVQREGSLSCISKDEFDELAGQFKVLDQNIFDHKTLSIDSNDRLEQLVDMMSSIANLDFSQIAEVRDTYNHLDYIALSLNMMRERLEEKVNSLRRVYNAFDSFNDLYLITNNEGIVLHANKVLRTQYQFKEGDVIGKHVQHFFNSDSIKGEFALDFTRAFSAHDVKREYLKNDTAKIVLKISGKVYQTQDGTDEGYCYKIEPISKAFYNNTSNKSKDSEIINKVYETIKQMKADSERRDGEKREVLKTISQTYMDKTDLSFMEIMILNSVNQLLQDD